MKKDMDLINEAYGQVDSEENLEEAWAALGGAAARALGPKVGGKVGGAIASNVGQQVAGAGAEAVGNKLTQQQEDSLDDSDEPGRKITDQQRGNRRKVIEDGVNTLVESHCKNDSPLTLREGYQHVKEVAEGKLQGLEEIGPLAAAVVPAVAGMLGGGK